MSANDAELCRLVISASAEELRVLLAGTPAGPFLEPGNEKMFGSVRSITSSAVEALKYTTRQTGAALLGAAMGPGRARQEVPAVRAECCFFPIRRGEIAAFALGDIGLDAHRDLRGPWTGTRAINGCGSSSTSWMRSARSTD